MNKNTLDAVMSDELSPSLTRKLFMTSTPSEVKKLIEAAPTIEKSVFRKMLKVALAHLQHSQNEEECEAAFDNICTALKCETELQAMAVSEEYSATLSLLRAALRLNSNTLRQQHLEADLLGLGLPAPFAQDVCRVVLGVARPTIDRALQRGAPRMPAVQRAEWKLEANLAHSYVPHLLEPVIAVTLDTNTTDHLPDDSPRPECHHLLLPLPVFHKLRLTVSQLLQQMDALEALPGGGRYSVASKTKVQAT